MKIVRVHIDHFGKLSDKTIEFSDGINVISGINESGKTTLHNFISAMLFGLERGRGRAAKTDVYSHYKPWDGGKYGGSITLEREGKTYTLIRDLDGESQNLSIIREDDGQRLPATREILDEITSGLNPSLFKNTISVGQLSAGTGKDLAGELRNHIVNLKSSGSYSLDVSGATNRLLSVRKKVIGSYNKDAELKKEELSNKKLALSGQLSSMIPVSFSEINKRRIKLEEKEGRLEDDNQEKFVKIDKIIEKNKLKSKVVFKILFWLLTLSAVFMAARHGHHIYVEIARNEITDRAYMLMGGAGACMLLNIIFAVFLGKSYKVSRTIKHLNHHIARNDKELVEIKNEQLLISEKRESLQRKQWEREKREEEILETEEEIEKLSPALESNVQIRKELEAIDLATQTIDKISHTEFASLGSFLEKLASALIKSITGGKYQGLSIGNDMEVSLIKEGARVELASVSSGTLDQVYLAVRLACIGFFWEEEDMPLLLDDTFALYDNSRLERTLTWLSQIYEGQTIIFTCHTREAEIMELLDIPFKLINL